MKRKNFRWSVSIAILVVGVWFTPGKLCAQVGEGERGYIEIGIRQLYGDRGSSKFKEYRHIPHGFFIRSAEVNLGNLLNDSFFFNFQSRDTQEKDQGYLLALGRRGKYRLDLLWDQTPHVFTNQAKTLFQESSPGVFTVAAPLRSRLQSTPADLPAWLQDARPIDVSLRRDKATGTFAYTPTSDWNVQLTYSKEKQTGYRPLGTTTNNFTNTLELPEPINYRTHQVKAGAEYANRVWAFQANYAGSLFTNQVGTLVWDNPFRTTDALNASSQGRIDLYPDNSAQRLSFAGAISLPHSTRLMASIAPGWMRQDDAFLPFTINTAITGVPALPASSLHGAKQTLVMNYTLTSQAIPAFPLTLRYRSYDYNNNTPSLIFSDWVSTDRALRGIARRNLPYGYDRKTLGLDASWEFWYKSALKFVYEWERFDREHRDVERSNEHTVGAILDFNPSQWFLFRTSYRHSERDPEEYEANEEVYPLGEGPFLLGNNPALRKLDEAARARHRAEALIQVTPVGQLSFGASYGTTQDRYDETGCTWLGYDQCYGLLQDINFNYTFELTYTPHPAVSLFAEYTREKYKARQRARQRTPPSATTGAPANDSPNNDWETNRHDLIDTWAAGAEGSLLHGQVIFEAFYSLAAANGSIRTRALGSPSIPGFLVTSARDYPNQSNRFHQLVASIKLRTGAVYPKFEYRYEKYGRVDFQIDRLNPYMVPLDAGTNTSIFLGADVPGYNAHVVAASLEYRF